MIYEKDENNTKDKEKFINEDGGGERYEKIKKEAAVDGKNEKQSLNERKQETLTKEQFFKS